MTRQTDLENKQYLCKIVHPGFDLVSLIHFGSDISEWNIVEHNDHSLMSKRYDPLYVRQSRKYKPGVSQQAVQSEYESKRE